MPLSVIGRVRFLSTPSARRATRGWTGSGRAHEHFYPRPPRGGRLLPLYPSEPNLQISIHALREEGDPSSQPPSCADCYFYPRPPRGGRRLESKGLLTKRQISIHALREEGDLQTQALSEVPRDFYPRPPRGGRRSFSARQRCRSRFLSTPSARRATFPVPQPDSQTRISIHALREEGDHIIQHSAKRAGEFLSTPSARRATIEGVIVFTHRIFLSTPSARRATCGGRALEVLRRKFLSTPSARRATGSHHPHRPQVAISIHALREEGDGRIGRLPHRHNHFYPRPPRGGRHAEKVSS